MVGAEIEIDDDDTLHNTPGDKLVCQLVSVGEGDIPDAGNNVNSRMKKKNENF